MCTIAINYVLFTYGLSISRKRLSQLIFLYGLKFLRYDVTMILLNIQNCKNLKKVCCYTNFVYIWGSLSGLEIELC